MKPGPGTASHRREITDRPVSRYRGLLDIPRVSRRVKVDAHALNSSGLFSFGVQRLAFCHRVLTAPWRAERRTLNAERFLSHRGHSVHGDSWPPASLIFHYPTEHFTW